MLQSLFNKVAEAFNFAKKRFQHRCFPVNIVKFLRTAILNNCERLLPYLSDSSLFKFFFFLDKAIVAKPLRNNVAEVLKKLLVKRNTIGSTLKK